MLYIDYWHMANTGGNEAGPPLSRPDTRSAAMTTRDIEFGLDTPAYVTVDESGQPVGGDVVIRNTVEEAVLADAVGIDSFNIGEHYRPELMDSAGHVMLAAIASRTQHIRLGTAVTVLSTQDPVRVYTEFATLDAVSNGRAQLIVGRGSLTDSLYLGDVPRMS
jgi:alkanesulfonate monooxygenase SsuD/methylene tetrahydromethanopterin reductase-like flavin-dependent oxidoreductase (luciferase family)